MRWTLFDYGVGNIHSLRKAMALHADVTVTDDPRALDGADAIVLPGVGAFGAVMDSLAPGRDALEEHHATARPLIGVCIGMQAFYQGSAEDPESEGLGFVGRRIERLPASAGKIPHMGWNTLHVTAPAPRGPMAPTAPRTSPAASKATAPAPSAAPASSAASASAELSALQDALAAAGHVYYVHSYAAPPGPETIAQTEYGMPFSAAIRIGNSIGFQFHPEKSSAGGIAILHAAMTHLETTWKEIA